MAGFMRIRVEDVEHGCCVMLQHVIRSGLGQEQGGRLAMIDSGSSADFKPSTSINSLGRDVLDYGSSSTHPCRRIWHATFKTLPY